MREASWREGEGGLIVWCVERRDCVVAGRGGNSGGGVFVSRCAVWRQGPWKEETRKPHARTHAATPDDCFLLSFFPRLDKPLPRKQPHQLPRSLTWNEELNHTHAASHTIPRANSPYDPGGSPPHVGPQVTRRHRQQVASVVLRQRAVYRSVHRAGVAQLHPALVWVRAMD